MTPGQAQQVVSLLDDIDVGLQIIGCMLAAIIIILGAIALWK